MKVLSHRKWEKFDWIDFDFMWKFLYCLGIRVYLKIIGYFQFCSVLHTQTCVLTLGLITTKKIWQKCTESLITYKARVELEPQSFNRSIPWIQGWNWWTFRDFREICLPSITLILTLDFTRKTTISHSIWGIYKYEVKYLISPWWTFNYWDSKSIHTFDQMCFFWKIFEVHLTYLSNSRPSWGLLEVPI